jgi:hypothetical protein
MARYAHQGLAAVKERAMKVYVAEIKGEPVVAFRAKDDDQAYETLNGKNGIASVLREYDRANGGVVWDGRSEIAMREATDAEHKLWRDGNTIGGKPIGFDDPDDCLETFLIPISDPLDEDGDENDEHTGH